jgi:hypothetical protein
MSDVENSAAGSSAVVMAGASVFVMAFRISDNSIPGNGQYIARPPSRSQSAERNGRTTIADALNYLLASAESSITTLAWRIDQPNSAAEVLKLSSALRWNLVNA